MVFSHQWTSEEDDFLQTSRPHKPWTAIANTLNVPATQCRRRFTFLFRNADKTPPAPVPHKKQDDREFERVEDVGDSRVITKCSNTVRSVDALLEVMNVNLNEWEVKTATVEKWDQGAKTATRVVDRNKDGNPEGWERDITVVELWLVKVALKRRGPVGASIMSLLDEIKSSAITLPKYKHMAPKGKPRRALEISILDPHIGLHCFAPQADRAWTFDEAEQAFMSTTERLVSLAHKDGPFERVVCAFGNDFLHADTLNGTTTHGTPQPEAASLKEAYLRGEKLALWMTERLRKVADLEVFGISGNHDEVTAFTMARLIRAFYAGAKSKDVTVHADPSPYKFWRYGVNLIGFEHGARINAIRMAAIMANETRLNGWKEARYCEWHLGDQHRKGSNKPSTFEEQGVSVEYLPGLTPANEWHKTHGYNWQKRGGFAFVYDHDAGPIARYQVNFDSYTGRHMGE